MFKNSVTLLMVKTYDSQTEVSGMTIRCCTVTSYSVCVYVYLSSVFSQHHHNGVCVTFGHDGLEHRLFDIWQTKRDQTAQIRIAGSGRSFTSNRKNDSYRTKRSVLPSSSRPSSVRQTQTCDAMTSSILIWTQQTRVQRLHDAVLLVRGAAVLLK